MAVVAVNPPHRDRCCDPVALWINGTKRTALRSKSFSVAALCLCVSPCNDYRRGHTEGERERGREGGREREIERERLT